MTKKLKISTIDQSTGDYFKGASLDEPPKVFEEGKPNWRKRHDEVISYARLLFSELAGEETLWQAQKNAITYEAFYTGSESPQPTDFEISMISANMINSAINLKNATLLNHRLEMHYIAEKNQDYDLAVAVQRLFDWQAMRTMRDYYKSIVELTSLIHGTCTMLLLPKYVYNRGRKTLIPAYPEIIDIRKCYFDPYEDPNDFTCFIIRDIVKGHLADQEYKEILDKRGLDKFPRGTGFSVWGSEDEDLTYWQGASSRSLYKKDRAKFLDQIGGDEVEMVRIWKRDYRTIKANLYKPFIDPATLTIDKDSDTEEAQYARYVASQELMPIIMTGHLPEAGQNHYNHSLVHKKDLEAMKKDIKLPDTETKQEQIDYMVTHIDLHEKYLDDGDQPADEIKPIPMFEGQWRFIKIIGNQIIADGSSDLEFEKFPVVMFRNAIDPSTSLGVSDVSQLANLNAANNSLLCDLLMNSHDNAFPDKRLPARFRNPEVWKEGEILYIEPDENEQDWMFNPVAPGQFPQQAVTGINIFSSMIERVGGGNATVRGEPGTTRSSGVETQTKLMAAQQRYMGSEVLFGFSWERFAEITLGQICQCMRDKEIMPIIGPEYQDVAPIIINAIDPYATIRVVRVPKDMDFENQNGQLLHQFGMLFMQGGIIPPNTLMKVLSSEGNAGEVGRIYGKFWSELQKPEVQQEIQQIKQQQAEAEMAKKSSSSRK